MAAVAKQYLLFAASSLTMLAVLTASVHAATPPALLGSTDATPPPGPRPAAPELPTKAAGPQDEGAALDFALAAVAEVQEEDGVRPALDEARATGLTVRNSRVDVIVETSDLGQAGAAVAALGGVAGDNASGLLQASIGPGKLRELAASPGVDFVRRPFPREPAAVFDQAVDTTNAGFWHTRDWDGSDVDVAIIDLGFQDYTALQASGDLPGSVSTVNFCAPGLQNGEPHGSAVAEAAFKLAPAARFYLICIEDEVDLSNAVTYAIENDIEIVNHSVAWFNTSRGDGSGGPGTPDAIVATARANGVLWINAAGNYGQRHWSGTWNDSNGDDYLNFSPEFDNSAIFIPAGASDCVFLKWNSWPVTAQDFDLLLTDFGGNPVTASANFQTGSQPPTEALCYLNDTGSSQYFLIWIQRFEASQSPRFDLFTVSAQLEFQVPAGSITEPASSPQAFAVGAVCWSGNGLESYSSRGPTIDGRVKPEVVGPDSSSSAIYGPYSTCGATGFAGTSQSSPHVAGLAALVFEQNPSFGAADVASFLTRRALDLGPGGVDNSFGFGLPRVYSFVDAPPGYPLYQNIEEFFARGITTGCGSDENGQRKFCPEQPLPRRGMATFLIRAMGETPFNNLTPTFADVPSSDPGYGFIERAFQLGLTNGCFHNPDTGERRYCPNDLIMRQGMAAFIVRALGLSPLFPSTPTFADVPATHQFFGEIERFFEQGITTGCSGTQFCPNQTTLRRAMAAFITRAFPAT